MSRWDALKPSTGSRLDDNDNRGRRTTSSWRSRRCAASKDQAGSAYTKESALHDATSRSAPESNGDVLVQYASLRDRCLPGDGSLKKENVFALAKFLQANYCLIPAETNAVVVQSVFLPLLEQSYISPTASGGEGNKVLLDLVVLQTLQILLRDSHVHASALLAPLTDHVAETTGTEICTINSIRRRLFTVLQKRLFDSQHECLLSLSTGCECACECLTTTLIVSSKIDKSCHNEKQQRQHRNYDLDGNSVCQFFDAVKLSSSPCLPSLLLACLHHQPSIALGLSKSLLMRGRPPPPKEQKVRYCPKCGFVNNSSTPDFLRLLHDPSSESVPATVVMDCATALLKELPLDIWLRPSDHSFRRGVIEALESLIQICLCYFSQNDTVVDPSFLSLVRTVLTHIPQTPQDTSLQQGSCELFDRLAWSSVSTSAKSAANNRQAERIIVECLGGQVTPHGTRVPMCSAAAVWFSCSRGCQFVTQRMLADAPGCDNDELVCAILRVSPSIVKVDAGSVWECFRELVKSRVSRQDFFPNAAKLIESFLSGRNDYPVETTVVAAEPELLSYILPLLQILVSDGGSTAQRYSACAAFGFLLQSDWSSLPVDEGRHNLKLVCDLCSDDNAKMRTQGFKTLGVICATVVPGQYFSMENSILQVLLQGMKDSEASVRCMALFSVGNVMQSFDAVGVLSDQLDLHIITDVASISLSLLNDHDHKVASNAVRAASYCSCIMLRNGFRARLEAAGCVVAPSEFLDQVLESYVRCLLSLLPSARDEVFLRLSGKQRSGAKKQGRAACIALGLLFARQIAHHTDASDAVICLLECIVHIKILDEKVAVSASNALRSLEQRTLSACVQLNDSKIGRAINACFNIVLSGASRGSRDILHAASLLLSHLLPVLKIADAEYLILNYCLSGNNDWMTRLNTWMIANKCPQESFKCFVRAIQLTDIEIAVQVEQLFVNQASKSTDGPENCNFFDEL